MNRMVDRFGTPLEIGDIVVQERSKMSSRLRIVEDIDVGKNSVKLGSNCISNQSMRMDSTRPSWVHFSNVAKYHNQGVFDNVLLP